MTRVEYAISTYKNLTIEEVEDFNKAMGLLPDSIDQYAEAMRRVKNERSENSLLSLKEVAEMLQVEKQTVTRLEREGCFYRVNDEGHPKYSYQDIREFAKGYEKNRSRK
jgi:hypothetical protein